MPTTLPLLLPEAWKFIALYASFAAFCVTLYALLGSDYSMREGRSSILAILPSITVSTLLSFVALLMSGSADVENPLEGLDLWANRSLFASAFLFFVSVYLLLVAIVRTHGRVYHLREDNYVKNSALYKWAVTRIKKDIDYEVKEPAPRTQQPAVYMNEMGCDIPRFDTGSILLLLEPESLWWELILPFVQEGLSEDESVHYVTCQHPSWYIFEKANEMGLALSDHHADLVFIDCYLEAFGFDDEILQERKREMQNRGFDVITAGNVSGVHTAAAKAFNITKRRTILGGTRTRRPHRMVYHSLSSLAELSSLSQVSTFYRHMIPSERTYGMITLIAESKSGNPGLIDTLKELSDFVVEARDDKLIRIK